MRFRDKISERKHRESLFSGFINHNSNKNKKLSISSPISWIIFSSTDLEKSHIYLVFLPGIRAQTEAEVK